MSDLIERQDAIDVLRTCYDTEAVTYTNGNEYINYDQALDLIGDLPSAQPEYEPVTVEDFAKTMSKYTVYRYVAWYNEALALMKERGFVICKKTM